MSTADPDISLLFDLFVTSQRVRRLVDAALADAPLRADEYALYSLLFEAGPLTGTEVARIIGLPLTTVLDHLARMAALGHLERSPHPVDGRARQVHLTPSGHDAFSRTHDAWEPMVQALEGSLEVPVAVIRTALRSLARAAETGLSRPGPQSESAYSLAGVVPRK